MTEKLALILDVVLSVVGLGAILWLGFGAFKNAENRGKLLAKWLFTLVVAVGCFHYALKLCLSGQAIEGMAAPFLMVFMGIVLSIMWSPAIGELITKPITGLYDGGTEPQEAKPLYSTAMAKRQRGKFLEATVAIREQLAKFPNDYEGIALLAKIQAEDMKDLPSAEMTLNRFCANPKVPQKQFAAAMRRSSPATRIRNYRWRRRSASATSMEPARFCWQNMTGRPSPCRKGCIMSACWNPPNFCSPLKRIRAGWPPCM
jgi:hypothetical protein